jgi:hypothetical protein
LACAIYEFLYELFQLLKKTAMDPLHRRFFSTLASATDPPLGADAAEPRVILEPAAFAFLRLQADGKPQLGCARPRRSSSTQ